MNRNRLLGSLVLGIALVMLANLSPSAVAQKGDKKSAAKDVDPPGTGALMNQYRGWFATHDLNKDSVIDKEELAKVFRGANAKPYDYQLGGKEPTTTQRAEWAKLPEYQFLAQLDTDKNEHISFKEFESWARDIAKVYSDQLKQIEEAQKRVLDFEARLLKNPNPKNRRQVEDDLRRERQQLDRLRDRIRDLERQQDRFKKKN